MPEQLYYLGLLLVSLCGLAVLDHRFRLAYFTDRLRTIKTLTAGLIVFIIWDLIGIGLGIFRIGDGAYLTGIRLASEFPLEELFFLALLLYTTLLAWRAGERLWPRT